MTLISGPETARRRGEGGEPGYERQDQGLQGPEEADGRKERSNAGKKSVTRILRSLCIHSSFIVRDTWKHSLTDTNLCVGILTDNERARLRP